jgi:hypothetical protein
MTKAKETVQEGPSFETKAECGKCKYLSVVNPVNRCGIIATCNKLNKELHQRSIDDTIMPHLDCPFKTLSQINYHKSKEKETNNLEFDKVKSIIVSVFKYSNGFEHDAYTLSITFHCSETITLNQIKQLEEKLPNYDISFDSYDSDDISVTLDMKAV